MSSLYTIGYAGHTIDTFVATLQQYQISALLDIRMTPISRKKGFSKTRLQMALEDANIGYYHLRTLGSPSSLRKKLYEDKDYPAFFQAFRDSLLHPEYQREYAVGVWLSLPDSIQAGLV